MRIRRSAPLVLVLLAGCGSSQASSERPCDPSVRDGVLPSWARTGFSDPRPRMPHVVSRGGRIAALLFSFPLEAARGAPRNKVLWVSRTVSGDPEPLRIRAQRMAGTRAVGAPVRRTLPAPGPSSFDLPVAGCWRLSLRWGDRTDELDLRYVRPGRA